MVFPLKFFFSSYIARFNLMQVGQLLQSLAILPYEQRFPSYFNEILSHLDKVWLFFEK